MMAAEIDKALVAVKAAMAMSLRFTTIVTFEEKDKLFAIGRDLEAAAKQLRRPAPSTPRCP